MDDLVIRHMMLTDSPTVARLVTQLGYPTTDAQMAARAQQLLDQPGYAVFVAERAGGVIGLVGVRLGHALEFDGVYGRMFGVVVDEDSRGLGIGTKLMEHVDRWLRTQGATVVTLTSGNRRTEAHRFYAGLGYAATGARFTKS